MSEYDYEMPVWEEDYYDAYDAEEEASYFDEPDLDEQFEIDSALTSAGWGTDEDYGYYGNEDAAMESALFEDC